MPEPREEKRGARRLALRLPIAVKLSKNGLEELGQTRDVSAHGVFFYLDSSMKEGANVEFTLTLPSDISNGGIRLRCCGKVVRVDANPTGTKVGVAVAIDFYDFVSQS